MTEYSLIEAITKALHDAMQDDPSVIVLGEDVAHNGGVFRATDGLLETFGEKRILDTPLAESMIAGLSIGMAAQGLKPVAEFQFMGFIYPAMNQIVTHVARLRNRTRGRLCCPLVFRAPYGGGIHAPEHHSESTEALFAHIPGLQLVIPSTPLRAYGLLRAAIESSDPVIFLEPKRIYRLLKQTILPNTPSLPLSRCFISREGKDITLVSWGAMLYETSKAAEQLSRQGVEAEVIDVATLKPLDSHSILNSVEKTGRCIIIHEAPRTGGLGAEIAAQINEYCLMSLLAPVKRVTGYDVTMPYFKLEQHYLPKVEDIIKTAQELMEYA